MGSAGCPPLNCIKATAEAARINRSNRQSHRGEPGPGWRGSQGVWKADKGTRRARLPRLEMLVGGGVAPAVSLPVAVKLAGRRSRLNSPTDQQNQRLDRAQG